MVFGLSKRSRRTYSSEQSALDLGKKYDDLQRRRIHAAPTGPHSVDVLPWASHIVPSHPYRDRGQIIAASMAQLPPQVSAPLVLPTASIQPAILPTSLSGLTKWTNSTFNHPISGILGHAIEKANATILDLDHLIHRSIGDGVNVRDTPSRVLDEVITSIDMGSFSGRERDLRKSSIPNEVNQLLIQKSSCRMLASISYRFKKFPQVMQKAEQIWISGFILQSISIRKLADATQSSAAEAVRLFK